MEHNRPQQNTIVPEQNIKSKKSQQNTKEQIVTRQSVIEHNRAQQDITKTMARNKTQHNTIEHNRTQQKTYNAIHTQQDTIARNRTEYNTRKTQQDIAKHNITQSNTIEHNRT